MEWREGAGREVDRQPECEEKREWDEEEADNGRGLFPEREEDRGGEPGWKLVERKQEQEQRVGGEASWKEGDGGVHRGCVRYRRNRHVGS